MFSGSHCSHDPAMRSMHAYYLHPYRRCICFRLYNLGFLTKISYVDPFFSSRITVYYRIYQMSAEPINIHYAIPSTYVCALIICYAGARDMHKCALSFTCGATYMWSTICYTWKRIIEWREYISYLHFPTYVSDK
jgi:hypothetical protein